MKVLYLIQTHKNPDQISRLVRTLVKSSPESRIAVSHNVRGCQLDEDFLKQFPNVWVLRHRVTRGDSSLLEGYLKALDWAFSNKVEFDWFSNITGQDYLTKSGSHIDSFLASTKFDGFLTYFDPFLDSESNLFNAVQCRDRYLYRYWRLTPDGWGWRHWRPEGWLNKLQPFIRLKTKDRIRVGFYQFSSPLNAEFKCYGGHYHMTLSRRCVEYIHQIAKQKPDLVHHYKRTLEADESFLQTVLLNSGCFDLCSDNKRYNEWIGDYTGHSKTLTVQDYPKLVSGDFHFARAFDTERDSQILDMLDKFIFGSSEKSAGGLARQ